MALIKGLSYFLQALQYMSHDKQKQKHFSGGADKA